MIFDLLFLLACIISVCLIGLSTLNGLDKLRAWWYRRRQERRMKALSLQIAKAYCNAVRLLEEAEKSLTPDRPLVEKLSEEAERPQLPAWFEASRKEFEEAREGMQ